MTNRLQALAPWFYCPEYGGHFDQPAGQHLVVVALADHEALQDFAILEQCHQRYLATSNAMSTGNIEVLQQATSERFALESLGQRGVVRAYQEFLTGGNRDELVAYVSPDGVSRCFVEVAKLGYIA